MSEPIPSDESFLSRHSNIPVWIFVTVLLLAVLPHVAVVALCDGWFDVRVSSAQAIPDNLVIHVEPIRLKMLEGSSDEELRTGFPFEKRLTNDGLTISVGHSHKNWCGYSYQYVQQYDALLVRYQHADGRVSFHRMPLPFLPKERPVEIEVPLPE